MTRCFWQTVEAKSKTIGCWVRRRPGTEARFESHHRQLIFLMKNDCLGCAMLRCLVCLFDLACFFFPSFSSLIKTCIYRYFFLPYHSAWGLVWRRHPTTPSITLSRVFVGPRHGGIKMQKDTHTASPFPRAAP